MTFSLNKDMAYLAGVIIGDGHLSNSVKSKLKHPSPDYRIKIEICDSHHMNIIASLIKNLVITKTIPRKVKSSKGKQRYYFDLRSKALHQYFSIDLEIPKGKKSRVVKVPQKIKNAQLEIKKNFLAGYFDADGGFRKNTLGFTTASLTLSKNIQSLLNELQIKFTVESWNNKVYNWTYHGINLTVAGRDRFLKLIPLRSPEKRDKIYRVFMRGCQSGQMGKV